MEKALWAVSVGKSAGARADDGLKEVNGCLEKGWSVKLISACAMGNVQVAVKRML
jgi:hypothetical protein